MKYGHFRIGVRQTQTPLSALSLHRLIEHDSGSLGVRQSLHSSVASQNWQLALPESWRLRHSVAAISGKSQECQYLRNDCAIWLYDSPPYGLRYCSVSCLNTERTILDVLRIRGPAISSGTTEDE
jgi:hypothetical protein